MEELVKFLTSKIGYTLVFILCIFAPGNLFIFIWNQELYFEMDIIRLIILSLIIPCIVYTINFGIIILSLLMGNIIFRVKSDIEECLSMAAIFTFIEVNGASFAIYKGKELDTFMPDLIIFSIKCFAMLMIIDLFIAPIIGKIVKAIAKCKKDKK